MWKALILACGVALASTAAQGALFPAHNDAAPAGVVTVSKSDGSYREARTYVRSHYRKTKSGRKVRVRSHYRRG